MVSSTEVNLRLKKLNETQDSIVATSKWIYESSVKDPVTLDVILFTIGTYISSEDPTQQVSNKKKLNLVYLLNDLSHLIKFKHGDQLQFVKKLDDMIPTLINDTLKCLPFETQQKVVRVVKIWKQRKVYPDAVLDKIDLKSVAQAPVTKSTVHRTEPASGSVVPQLKTINNLYTKYETLGKEKSLEVKKDIIRNLELLLSKEKREYQTVKNKSHTVIPTLGKKSTPPPSPLPPLPLSLVDVPTGEIPTYAESSSSDSEEEGEEGGKEEKHVPAPSTDISTDGTGSESQEHAKTPEQEQPVQLEQEPIEEYNPSDNMGEPATKKAKLSSPTSSSKPNTVLTSNIQDLLNRLSNSKK